MDSEKPKTNRAARRRQQTVQAASTVKRLDDAQALGLNAAQDALNRAQSQLEQAKILHIKVMLALGLDPAKNYELDAANNVYLKEV